MWRNTADDHRLVQINAGDIVLMMNMDQSYLTSICAIRFQISTIHALQSNNSKKTAEKNWVDLFWDDFPIMCVSEWNLDPPTHFHS